MESTDYVGALLDSGRKRAQAEGHCITFQEADQERAPSELVRVCKPGGRIGLANWTPESFIGQLFKTIGRYVPPAAAVKSPALWGTTARLDDLFAASASQIRTTRRDFVFRYRSPMHWVEVFRTYYGPLTGLSRRSIPTSRRRSPGTFSS
jgi:hypothetical protein